MYLSHLSNILCFLVFILIDLPQNWRRNDQSSDLSGKPDKRIELLLKETEKQIALNDSYQREKEGRRSKALRVLQFLIKLSKGATDMNELYCWICDISIYSFILWYILHFSNWMFLAAMPQPGLSTKLKNIVIQTVLSRKQQLGLIEKWWKWKVSSKKRRAALLWTGVLQFLLRKKEGQRSKAQGSCSFSSKTPLPNMGSICKCVFWIYLKRYFSIL